VVSVTGIYYRIIIAASESLLSRLNPYLSIIYCHEIQNKHNTQTDTDSRSVYSQMTRTGLMTDRQEPL